VNMFQGALASACENIKHLWLIHEFPANEFAYYADKLDFIADYSDQIYAVVGELTGTLNQLFSAKKVLPFIPFTTIQTNQLLPAKKRRLISIGRLTERKNQLELIQAYHRLAPSDLELQFIGGWDSEYKQKCDQYIQ